MKKTFYLTLVIINICISGNLSAQMESSFPPDKPKLVVGIVVEQMRQDYLERFWNKFSQNGFKKLAINGTYFKNAQLNYSLTQSNPGFATIVTGSEPSGHGIVSDYWFLPLSGEQEGSTDNKKYAPVGVKGVAASFSPEKMFSSSFSDEAKIFNRGKSRVVSLSLNPHAAVLSGSFGADAAYWFDIKSGKWISNTYYMKELPGWVNEVNNRKSKDSFLERKWNTIYDLAEYTEVWSDTSRYEFGIYGTYKKFPYDYAEIRKQVRDYELYKMIPEGNTITNDFAIAALLNEKLGKNEFTDFLFITYSVSENIGNLYGPQSVELMDLYLRLDADIAHLISVLEESVGKNNFIIYLTSNCGVSEVPQYLIDNKMPGGYFKHHFVRALLNSYLRALYGEGNWILDFGNNQIYLNKTLIEDSQISLAEFQNNVAGFILNSGGISFAISSFNLQNNVFLEGIPRKMQNSFNPKRSGDIMISLSPGWIEDMTSVVAHNSGYSYDIQVPLLWYGWKVKRQTIYEEVNITNIAPTVSMILGTPKPPLATGKAMQYIFLNK